MAALVALAVPVPSLGRLTYRVPDGMETPDRGARVLVPLGARLVTGCVVSSAGEPVAPPPGEAVKEIAEVLDAGPFLTDEVIDLAIWIAEYYMCGLGEALGAAAPPFAWVESRMGLRLADPAPHAPTDATGGRVRAAILRWMKPERTYRREVIVRGASRLLQRGRSVEFALDGGEGRHPEHALRETDRELRILERQGLVVRAFHMEGRADAAKTVRAIRVTAAGLDEQIDEGLPPRQRAALGVLRGASGGVDLKALSERGFSRAVVAALETKGLARQARRVVERDPFGQTAGRTPIRGESDRFGVQLTPEQRAALERLETLAAADEFRVALLHGVTGSGKTEVYRRLAMRVRDAGRPVLILVPEIALTPAAAATFRFTFGNRVAIQHSGLSSGERHDQWHRIRRGEVDVVVGTRSAVFAPLARPGLIVVDEEHDTSYKQEEAPRYHGRDVAIVRGRAAGALVVLASATPSLETAHNARIGRYERIVMSRRVADRRLADVRVVDMRAEYASEGPDVVLSGRLREALEETLAAGDQAIVLLNRRGYASAVFCRQCGATLECPNCSVSLTVYRAARRAECHYCDYTMRVPSACTLCGAEYLDYVGVGTERVEAEVASALPGARVARVDRDTMRRRGEISRVLGRFAARELDVLVGTQMIAKGHDFPAVTLVGVISADIGLGLADFRAAERTFQLLTQVAGRAGRGDRAGEAIIQTLFPNHYSIRHARTQDYAAFFEDEWRYRQSMRYPPAVALINVIVRGRSLRDALGDAADVAAVVRRGAGRTVTVLGPAPAPLGRLRGEHRAQFFLKGTARRAMRETLAAALAARPDLTRRVSVDVDPLSVL